MTAFMSTTAVGASPAAGANSPTGRDYASLGQADFLRLLTVQIQQQDPMDPVDNKEMLAQMAQFSAVAGISEMGETLEEISGKLDLLARSGAATQQPEE